MASAAGPNVVEDGLVLALDAGNTKSYSSASNVSLLLHGDGTNGSTTFTDSSSSNHTITAYGNAQISTTQSKFGGSSMYFDGSGDYLTAPVDSSFEFGTGDFTVECWLYLTNNTGYRPIVLLGNGASGGPSTILYSAWYLYYFSSTGLSFYRFDGTSTSYNFSTTLSTNTWYHIAVSRSGTSLRCFVDGTQVGSTVTTSLSYNKVNNDNLHIGRSRTGSNGNTINYLNGYIDDLRITKGLARYTSNFTPPTTALAGPAIQWTDMIGSNTGTLVNGVGFDSNNLGSLSFDGTDDYVTISDSEDLEFGSGDFTIEAYIYPTGVPSGYGYACIFAKGAPLQCYFMNTNSLSLFVDTDNNGSPYSIISNTNITGNNTVNQDEWTHIVISRSGDTWKVFTGGVQRYSATHSGTIFNNTGVFSIGDYAPSSGIYPFQGYISNLKVYKGKALTVAEVQQNYNALKGRYLN